MALLPILTERDETRQRFAIFGAAGCLFAGNDVVQMANGKALDLDPPLPSVVERFVSTTKSRRASSSGLPSRSTRRKRMPLLGAPGAKVMFTRLPLCSPRPEKLTLRFRVCCCATAQLDRRRISMASAVAAADWASVHLNTVLVRWQLSRRDNSARVQRSVRGKLWMDRGLSLVRGTAKRGAIRRSATSSTSMTPLSRTVSECTQ